MAAVGSMDVHGLFALLSLAAFCGDNTNYWIGHYVGPRIFRRERSRLLNPAHLQHTQRFYEKHGGKTVVLARFMPILRTFAPFVAGLGAMQYRRFLSFSLLGNLLWIGLFSMAGFLFGNIPWVKNNFSSVIVAIILISLLPMVIAFIKEKFHPSTAK